MKEKIQRSSISENLLYGFAIAAIGGPLALVMIGFFSSAYGAGAYSPYALLIGLLLFLAPLMIWYNYSKKVASSGGLYAFVEKSLGAKAAKLQGWLWLIGYFLYLPYTIFYMTYDLLPVLFRNLAPYLAFIDIGLTVVIVLPLLLSTRKTLYFILVTAVIQLLIIIAFAFWIFSGSFIHSLGSGAGTSALAFTNGALATSLLFVGSSLVLFLGGEVRGGGKGIGKAMVTSFAVVAIFFVLGSMAFVNATARQAGSYLPGFSVLSYSLGRNFAYMAAILTIVSIVDLVMIEFIAMTRLSSYMFKIKLDRSVVVLAGLFIFASLVSVTNPRLFSSYELVGAVSALCLSLLIVFVSYPFFRKRELQLNAFDVLITLISVALMLYGIYTVLMPYMAAL